MNDEPTLLLFGKNIPWKKVQAHPFRVKSHSMLARIEQGKITTIGPPYALLILESPVLKKEMGADGLLLVEHPVDFKHLWEIFNERGITEEEEVWISYNPITEGFRAIFASWMAKLHLFIYPKGSLDILFNTAQGEPKVKGPIATWSNE